MSGFTRLPNHASKRGLFRSACQMVGLILFWYLADQAARALTIPISGGIIGLILLLILMLAGLIKTEWIEGGAELILAHLVLYFIPLVVSVVQYIDLFQTLGVKIAVAIGAGFLSVLLTTALVVDGICLVMRKRYLNNVHRSRAKRMFAQGSEKL